MRPKSSSERTHNVPNPGKIVLVVGIMLGIAFIHAFRLGSYLEGPLFLFYYSYFSDIIIPFGFYFMLCLNDVSIRWLEDWRVKALLIFVGASLTEVAQAFGIYLLGVTFDPLDIVMFGVGVLLAVFVDRVIFRRIFPFWSP
jgi:hypothetical protein